MSQNFELGAPYNWCDRRCERCPLATSCAVAADPRRDLTEILQEALATAEAICREEGIDPDRPVARSPPSVERLTLEHAGRAWARAFADLEHHVADVPWRMIFVAGKVARLAGAAEDYDDDLWTMDAIPNLLVLEHVLEGVRADVDRAAAAPARLVGGFRERDAALRSLLAPLFATITVVDRAMLSALAAHGRAPSPFATTSAPVLRADA